MLYIIYKLIQYSIHTHLPTLTHRLVYEYLLQAFRIDIIIIYCEYLHIGA